MLLAEYDYDTDIAVRCEESFDLDHERGRIEGEARGKSLGLAEGKSLGLTEGKSLGLAEGKSLGLAEGKLEGKLETARNLRTMGLSIENIAKATGLSIQEVQAL